MITHLRLLLRSAITLPLKPETSIIMPVTRAEFEEVFPKLMEDLSEHAKQYNIPPNALKWYQDVSPFRFPPPP